MNFNYRYPVSRSVLESFLTYLGKIEATLLAGLVDLKNLNDCFSLLLKKSNCFCFSFFKMMGLSYFYGGFLVGPQVFAYKICISSQCCFR